MRVCSEDWVVDTRTRQVVRGGKTVHASPKAFELLSTLLAERPRAMSKAELLRRLWPDTFVTEASLASLVAEVRSLLGDTAREPRYVRTVQRFGYAFCGSVVTEAGGLPAARAAGSARLVWEKRDIVLSPGENVLGRTPEALVWIDSVGVSRRHARILLTDAGAVLEDLGSKNGTYVNGVRLDRPHPLVDGDEIRLGSVRIVFRTFSAPLSTETESS
jgi:DNA-binding winged helix-turn-helix (wHTH) protein